MYKKKTNDIFKKEFLVVEDLETSEYIKKNIAKKLGISCNINFFTEKKLIYYILKKFIFIKKYTIFKKSNILWELINLSKNKKKLLYTIKKNKIEEFKYFQKISKIFYEYLIYRPKWILNWECKRKEKKKYNKKYYIQKKIWKKIIQLKKKKYHYVDLFNNFFIKNFEKKYIYKNLPSKIFIINPFNFTISNFKILKKISKKIEIYIFLCVPFNIKYSTNKKYWEKYSILSNWTKKKIEIIKYIYSLTKKRKYFFIKKEENNLLNKLKNNFLLLKDNINKKNKEKIKIQDDSISIHECNNYLREIEILHENILHILNNNKKIQPKNIIIKTNNIKNYIPYIKSIFKNNVQNINIPYSINKPLSKKNPIIYVFNKILSLPYSKFKNKNVLDFLNFKFISKKFKISHKELKKIIEWTKETNIRWGINSKHKKKIKIYPTEENTWKYGIKKIILGYGVQKNIKNLKKIQPYSIYEKNHIKLLEKLIYFINTLIKWNKKLSKKKKIKTWKKNLKKIIKDFFYLNKKNKKICKIIKTQWMIIIKEIKQSSYKKKISVKIFKYYLNSKLKKIYFYKKFNENCVTFTNFNFLRTVNFKITYCLGMNNNFPKKNIKNSENLINKYKKFGDFNKKIENYFIFFELISFTTKKFYISYINDSPNKIEKQEKSYVIQKIKKYIENNFYSKKNILDNILYVHPKTNFEEKNFSKNICNSFQKMWILKKNSFYQKKNIKKIPLLYKIKKINIKKLILFWSNPINYYFNKTLNIYFLNKNYINYNQEPFILDTKNNYLLEKKIFQYIYLKKNLSILYEKIKYTGIFPHKNFRKILLKNKINKIKNFYKKIKNLKTKFFKKNFSLKINKFKIYGMLKNLSSNRLFQFKTCSLNYYDKISLWLKHLVYCSIGGEKSTYIGINKTFSFKKLSCKKAKKNLLKYIFGYVQGLKKPIILTKTGLHWFHYIFDKKNKKISKEKKTIKDSEKKMIEIWNGNKYFIGEKKNLYLKKIIPKLNKKNIKNIQRTTKYWISPIYKNIL
jgi:exodeoxyribonuclease V gamma subunit